MSDKSKDIDLKHRTYSPFDETINIKKFYSNKIKIDEKSYKNIFIYYMGNVTVKNLRYVKISSVNPLYIIINEINRYIKASNGNKYLTLVLTDESKGTSKYV